MKKMIALIVVASVMLLAACQGASETQGETGTSTNSGLVSENETSDASKDKEEYVIGLSMPGMNGSAADSYEKIIEAFEAYPNVKVVDTNAGNNAMTQVTDIENLIGMDADLIIAKTVDNTTAAPALNAARAKGIPVVVFDGNCVDANGEPAYDHFFGSNDYEIGVFLAEQMIEKYGETANYVLYEGPAGISVFKDRAEGFHSVIDQYSGWVMLASQTGVPGRANDQVIMENWIQAYGDKIDVVIDFTDENAIGASNALAASDITKDIKIASVTGQMEVMPYVIDGTVLVEVATSSNVIPMVPACYAILTEGAEIPQNYICPPYAIGAEEAEEYYIEGEFRMDDYDHQNNPLILGGLEYYAAEGYEWFDEKNYDNIFIN